MSIEEYKDQIDVLDKVVTKNRLKLAKLRLELMYICKHPKDKIVGYKYKDYSYLGALSPYRVCSECGLAEEGWGCGYKILQPDCYDIETESRDSDNRIRHVEYFSQNEKGLADKRKFLKDRQQFLKALTKTTTYNL